MCAVAARKDNEGAMSLAWRVTWQTLAVVVTSKHYDARAR